MAPERNTPQSTDMTPVAPASAPSAAPPPAQNASERYTAMVMRQFGSSVGAPDLTDFQKRLIQGYFIGIDRALKAAEDERLRKNANNSNHMYDNDLPVTWENVNLIDLALDTVHYARMGLDMMQDNHLFPIPFKNNKTNKYDVTLMKGYNGVQYIAEKYALERPVAVTIELVYDTDTFRPIKKGRESKIDSYEFAINEPFDRGEIKGGFGYIEYADAAKNKLIIMPLKDILKRKPKYASPNFWGGTATEWQTVEGKRQKVEVQKEGWFAEMCEKTLKREVYSAKHIQRDPQKIDENYQYMKLREAQIAEMQAQAEIDAYANGDIIDTTPAGLPSSAPSASLPAPQSIPVNPDTGEIIGSTSTTPAPTAVPTQSTPPVPPQDGSDGQQSIIGGPDF